MPLQVCAEKLLGIKLDEQLNFNQHINDLCRKLSQRIGVLNTIKRNLPINEQKLFYNAMTKPIMLYGSCVWSSTSCDNINRIHKLQKRAARVILNAGREERSANLFEQLNWLPPKDEIMLLLEDISVYLMSQFDTSQIDDVTNGISF